MTQRKPKAGKPITIREARESALQTLNEIERRRDDERAKEAIRDFAEIIEEVNAPLPPTVEWTST